METGGGELDRDTLCSALDETNASLGFLLFFVASLLLSFWATAVSRKGVCLLLAGETAQAQALPDTYPLRRVAGALGVGALGFFLCLAAKGMAEAGDTPAAARTAWANLWAALLAMAAGVLRLLALEAGQAQAQPALSPDSALPD